MNKERRKALFALWVLFGINAMNFFDRQIPSAVTEPIRKEWALSDTQVGLLGTAFTLIYAAVGVPLGRAGGPVESKISPRHRPLALERV